MPFPQNRGTDAEKKTQHASEQERPDVAEARAAWREHQPFLKPQQLVFIDETWAATNTARRYARALRGNRAPASAPYGHWKTTTFLAALRHDRIEAPCVFDGAINGARFRAWVEQFLAPTLAPGDIVIMDNLSSHKVAGIREAIERPGAFFSTRRPTALISIRSSKSSPSSRPCSEPPAPEHATPCGTQSVLRSAPSVRTNVPTTSKTLVIPSE